MRESFSTILDDIADEGRSRMRPFPAASVHALAKTRQRRRQQVAAATCGVIACAVAAGVVFGTGGAKSGAKPVTPGPRPTSSVTAHWTMPTDAVFGPKYLQDSELPNARPLQWKHDVTMTVPNQFDAEVCGSAGKIVPRTAAHSKSAESAQYRSPYSNENSFETIYHYTSETDAEQDYERLVPDPARCQAEVLKDGPMIGHLTGSLANGFAWVQQQGALTQYIMVAQSGSGLAMLTFQVTDTHSLDYDLGGDQAVLQRMADRIAGLPVTPVTVAAPPGMLINANWLTATEIPYAASDKSLQGWVQMGTGPIGPDDDPPSVVCGNGDIGADKSGTSGRYMFHGTPQDTPEDPVTKSLYSSANETIHTLPDPTNATAVFEHAKALAAVHTCSAPDPSDAKKTVTYTVKTGVVTTTGFSVAIDDVAGNWHRRLYLTVKGNHLAELSIGFEQPGAGKPDDAAVLALMAARLP